MITCTANTGGNMPCACIATEGELCYYHNKMSLGLITPHRDFENMTVKTRTGKVVYSPSDRRNRK